MFKGKLEAKYFHGEFSAQGLWQDLCFFRTTGIPWASFPQNFCPASTSLQHWPTSPLAPWHTCSVTPEAQRAAAGAAMNKCHAQAGSLNSYSARSGASSSHHARHLGPWQGFQSRDWGFLAVWALFSSGPKASHAVWDGC